MIIAVAGSAGAGKTFVAVNLAGASLSPVSLVDMDVSKPRCAEFITAEESASEPVFVPVPRIDAALCDSCGECVAACHYKALRPFRGAPQVFPALCHSGGSCRRACPTGAISLAKRLIGSVETGVCGSVTLISGKMSDHEHMGGFLKRAMKRRAGFGGFTIVDCPEADFKNIQGPDIMLLVADASPRGLYELSRSLVKARETGLPCGVILNRSGQGDWQVERLCRRARIPILLRIPNSARISGALAEGRLLVDELPRLRLSFRQLLISIKNQAHRPSRLFLMGPAVRESDMAALAV